MSGGAWLKFYTSDWRSEPTLRVVSREARSFWIDCLCLIHEAGTGRLEVGGRPATDRDLASILGDNPRTVRKLLAELEGAGVFSRDEAGFIVSRRIIRDIEKAARDRENGKKGGNPALVQASFGGEFDLNSGANSTLNESRTDARKAGNPGHFAEPGITPRSQNPDPIVQKESPLPPKGGGGAPAPQKAKRRKVVYTEPFEAAWTLWKDDLDLDPGGKDDAARAWAKLTPSQIERFPFAAKKYASIVARKQRGRTDGWNGCAMSTFLNGGRIETHNPETSHGQGPVQRGAADERHPSPPAPDGPGDVGDLFRPSGGVGEDERGGDPGREAAGGCGGDPGVAVVGALGGRWPEPAVRGDGGRAHLAGREPVARHRADADAGRVHRVVH